MQIITQRSRIEHFESCPRRGYYHYLYGGRGIERKGFDPDQLVGLGVHAGIEHMLKGAGENEAAPIAVIAVSQAINELGLAPMVVETELGFETITFSPNQKAFLVNLVEALVRGFARVRLPRLLDEFTILSIEQEETYQLSSDIKFLSRSDFVAERKADKQVFIFNLKTLKFPWGAWRKKFHYDQQTLSELLGVEERLGRKAGGVIIEGLIKGSKSIEWPKGSKVRYNSSPLMWAWEGPDNSPFPADVKVKYEYTDEYGKPRRLGPSYNRVPAYTVMPIREWIDKVQREAPDVLEGQFITLPPVLRSDPEIESWKTSTIYKEQEIVTKMGVLNSTIVSMPGVLLDQQFPMHTSNGNCLGYGDTTCPFFAACWLNASPDDPDLFRPRTLNHPTEGDVE